VKEEEQRQESNLYRGNVVDPSAPRCHLVVIHASKSATTELHCSLRVVVFTPSSPHLLSTYIRSVQVRQNTQRR
jgi:hypothetical protein